MLRMLNCRGSLALVLLPILLTFILAEESSLSSADTLACTVGKPIIVWTDDGCCKYGSFTSCAQDTQWACVTDDSDPSEPPNIVCNAGSGNNGSCTASSCNAQTGQRCGIESGGTALVKVDSCTATGAATFANCPAGKVRCEKTVLARTDPNAPTVNQTRCGNGSNYCSVGQPNSPCN